MDMATVMATATGRTRTNESAGLHQVVIACVRIVGIGLATVALAYAAFSAAFVNITASANPTVARTFDVDDPVALAAAADALLSDGLTDPIATRVRRFASRSLSAQALNPRALRLLATSLAQGASDNQRWGLLTLSHRMSRREIGTQLLLIEKNAQTDAIGDTLKHYNIALTTNRGAQDRLFPILATAIEDQAINREFANLMASKQPWMDAFIRFKLERDKTSNALVDAGNAARMKPSGPAFDEMKQYLFEQSLRTGNYAAARQFYAKYNVAEAGLLQTAAFAPLNQVRRDGLMRWQLFELPYILPQIVRAEASSAYELTVEASSSARGTVATKLMMLPPGSHRVAIDYGNVAFTPSSFATWTVRCVGTKADPVIWTANIASAAPTRTSVSIPEQCGAQMIELAISSGADQTDNVLTVKSIIFTAPGD